MGQSLITRPWILWVLTAIITLSSVFYQRMTGPTHDKRGGIEVDGQLVKYKLFRTHDTTDDAVIEITIPGEDIKGEVTYKRFKSHDEWTTMEMTREGDKLVFRIPKQPSAGKVIYTPILIDSKGSKVPLSDEPIIIRFKDPVPKYFLWPHVLFMLHAMIFSTRAGLEVLASGKKVYKYTLVTTILLFLGGLILGPIVQKYAFGAFWTGWPLGHDLTDNKTALAMFAWIVAIWQVKKKGGGKWVVIAAIVMLLVYLIPHSVLGSELDYTQST